MNTGSNSWIMMMYRGVVILAAIVILSANITLLLRKDSKNNNSTLISIKAFGGFNLVGYIVFFASSVLSESASLYVSSGALLFLNIIPIIWIKKYFMRYYMKFSSDGNLQFLDVILQNYSISNREREIMDLILKGKSNKEIEDMLFISYNTVKNHIYNLYQKLGVKSRGQMINFVLEARKQVER
jgi:DNA-binding CsgD family transcriptional regulator